MESDIKIEICKACRHAKWIERDCRYCLITKEIEERRLKYRNTKVSKRHPRCSEAFCRVHFRAFGKQIDPENFIKRYG